MPTPSLTRWSIVPLLLLVVGCKAGPSAFDQGTQSDSSSVASAPHRPEDTADASTLPRLPTEAQAPDGASHSTPPAPTAKADTSATKPAAEERAVGHRERADTAALSQPTASAPEPKLHFDRPEHIRGLYLNAWTAGSTRRVDELLALAKRTEINTFVIDIKDASGYVSYDSKVPLAVESGATGEIRIRDLPGLLERLKKADIYPIARIVVIKDPILTEARPDLAVQDTDGGVWVDDKGFVWLNPYNHKVWDYAVDLAKEVAGYGFPEIQWDYVRFPDAPDSVLARATYPESDGRSRAEAIHGFLEYSREQLGKMGVRVTADVFGVTASATRDVGIGQVWTQFINAVDVALPMVYPSHYWQGSFGFKNPNAYPYEVVRHALSDALRQSSEVKGAGKTRPWLQDFTLGKPAYGAPEVRAEIQAVYDVGIHDWILWNAGSRYTESALEPVGGFKEEPMIRVAGKVVPVSERFQVLGEKAAGNTKAPRADTTSRAVKPSRADTTVSKLRRR